MLPIGIATLAVSLGTTLMLTPWVVMLARRIGALDHPSSRKLHSEPIPRIGGVAVFGGFMAGLVYAAWVTGNLWVVPTGGTVWRGFGLAAVGMFAVGLVDDIRELSFRWKLAAQIAAALLVWYFGFRIEVLSHPFGGTIDLGILSLPVTLIWIVGVTNAVNLLDGLDGLATGTAVIMTSAIAVIAFVNGDLGVTAVGVALAGSLVGFLWFNFNPARIFLGDSGTLFLGFVLAVSCVSGNQKGPAAVAILAPLLVMGLPVLDTAFAVVRRLHRLSSSGRETGNPWRYVLRNIDHVFLPDRGHIHHRLLDLGLSHRNAVLVLYGVVSLTAAAAFALVLLNSLTVALCLLGVLLLLLLAFFALLWVQSRGPRPREPEADGHAGPELGSGQIGAAGDLGRVTET